MTGPGHRKVNQPTLNHGRGGQQMKDDQYEIRTPRSRELAGEAMTVLPGGASSHARTALAGWTPYPPSIACSRGSAVWDVDGNEYVDYLGGLGPAILGHCHPLVTEAVHKAVSDIGCCLALPYELEAEAARKVSEAVPSVDLLRFCNSGSEAVASAIRLARTYTGRRLVVRFEGHYHGWQDTIHWNAGENHKQGQLVPASPGIPDELARTLAVLPWNDPEAIGRFMSERGEDVAAVITEPVMCNAGCILPADGYLRMLREITQRHGALLIFDEVITGFRVARGGAQELYHVRPDLTALAKGLGGGFPVAAFGGVREVMSLVGDGRYPHAGTYNGNVVATAAVSATMDALAEPGIYERQRALGEELCCELQQMAEDASVPVSVAGLGTVFQVWFSSRPVGSWRDASRYADRALFARWHREMLLRGVLFHPSQYETMFLSLVHTQSDVSRMLDAAKAVLLQLRTPDVRSPSLVGALRPG
jgi:glutamate-1-semialdehyde 2,1-aminomutase